jgi:WD40 repeat protein
VLKNESLTPRSWKQVNVSVSYLRSLAEDCLRFTMHFFHPIQQSASHIYHSALPLSPKLSTYPARTLSWKTKITGFCGRSDVWGIIVRSITAGSQPLTCMATFGHKIAAAHDDGRVGVYDSVTGVLRLSLSLADPAQAIRGSPDGSILFCAHKTPSVTAWDMQTGGLIHTFVSEQNAEDIAVSLNGRYLACRLSDRSFEVWEVSGTMEGAAIWTGSSITCFCWLEPEEHLAVSTGGSVCVWDIVAGTALRSYPIQYPVRRMVYSQKINRLAIMASSGLEGVMAVINPQTGTSTASHWIYQNVPCFAFSQTAEELVCGMETHGIQLFNISTQRLRHIEYQDTMTSVSCLQNGTVVANFMDSGIQLLSLDGTRHAPSQQLTISPLTMHGFDQNRIIVIFPTSRDHILLLEPATLSRLLKVPVDNTSLTPTDDTTILCASYKNQTAVYFFEEGDTGFLQLWRFREEVPRWTVEVDGVPKICRISPTGVRLVTLHTKARSSRVCVWDTHNGQLNAQLEDIPPPLDIEFASDTEFSLQYKTHRKPYAVRFWGLAICGKQWFLPPLCEGLQERRHFSVDYTNDWVLDGSKRICWIPPGYIGSTQPSYCWVGHSLVMVGQNATLRSLTFTLPGED